MATTISNNELGAVATTSEHKAATSGATDVNWNPPVKVQVPHANEAKSADATEHTTDKTKFQDGNVVRQGDAIGPPSGPPHGDNGAGGGVKSATHLKEARVTTGSTDVKVEGKPLTRSTDPTTNNTANTNGTMKGADPTEEAKRLEQEKKKACSMESVKGKCQHGGTMAKVGAAGMKHGLSYGPGECPGREPGKDKVLEVVTPASIIVEATRKNAKEASKPPECEKNEHTQWLVSKWYGGKKLREEKLTGDKQTLEEAWFDWDIPGFFGSSGEAKPGDKTKQFKREAVAQVQSEYDAKRAAEGRAPKTLKPPRGRQRANQMAAASQSALETKGTRVEGVQAAIGMAVNIAQFIRIWNAYNQPIEVKVEALACSGGEKYLFRSVPGTIVEFRLEKETLEKVRAACATIERFVKIFDKLASLAGISGGSVLKLCHVPDVEFEVEWQELGEDVAAIKKYKHHVDRAWELTFQFEKLIEWKKDFGIPVAPFLNFFAPGAGTTIHEFMRIIGLEATIGVEIDFGLMPALWAARDAGATVAEWGGGVKVALVLFFRAKIKWGDTFELAVGAVLDFDIKVGAFVSGLDLWGFELKAKGDIKVGLKGHYRVNFWWKSYGDNFEYFPDACKLSLPEFGFKPLALLKS